ncbi:uncharacterized protein LOC117108228 [Anneissia japonica]|uniref:uncharacterized protein LOC117108228 n=1 Tax=Anneissia japonica TaxID=1529436 RepID=UPI0014257012|nr:uncharacterized protein LOC117108228 [Anneissia japonica]XP_033106081.1 uncharacterized protein LOC117108228 [Anneissia japonica]
MLYKYSRLSHNLHVTMAMDLSEYSIEEEAERVDSWIRNASSLQDQWRLRDFLKALAILPESSRDLYWRYVQTITETCLEICLAHLQIIHSVKEEFLFHNVLELVWMACAYGSGRKTIAAKSRGIFPIFIHSLTQNMKPNNHHTMVALESCAQADGVSRAIYAIVHNMLLCNGEVGFTSKLDFSTSGLLQLIVCFLPRIKNTEHGEICLRILNIITSPGAVGKEYVDTASVFKSISLYCNDLKTHEETRRLRIFELAGRVGENLRRSNGIISHYPVGLSSENWNRPILNNNNADVPVKWCSLPTCKKSDENSVVTLKLCGNCKLSRYCSVQCQRQHWESGHREKCCVIFYAAAAAEFGDCS